MFLLSIIMGGAIYLHSVLGVPVVMPITTFLIVVIRFVWFLSDACQSKKPLENRPKAE